jgi:hypothetical protein
MTSSGEVRCSTSYVLPLEPLAGKIGSLPIPKRTLEKNITRLLNSPETRDHFRLPPGIGEFQVANGKVEFLVQK